MKHILLLVIICALFFNKFSFAEAKEEPTTSRTGKGNPFALVEDFPENPEGDPELLNPGNLKMFLHAPSDMPENAPVVFVLHGCSKGAAKIKEWAGWNELADKHKFYVVYPQQQKQRIGKISKTGNFLLCFNWSGTNGQMKKRGEGEDKSIIDMISYLKDNNYSINEERVFITGFSAGGAMANLMLAYWPDKFAGGASIAGVPFHCATTVKEGLGCMGVKPNFATRSNSGPGCEGMGEACMDPKLKRTPEGWKDLVVKYGKQNYSGPYPLMMAWHGGRDQYVDDDNMQEIMKQWTAVHGIDQKADNEKPILKETYTDHEYSEYRDSDGNPKVATLLIPRMFHSIPVEPGNGKDQGGIESGRYSVDYGLHSSYYTAKFWGLVK